MKIAFTGLLLGLCQRLPVTVMQQKSFLKKKLDSPSADVVLRNPPLFPDGNSVSDNRIPELSEGENSLLTVFSFL